MTVAILCWLKLLYFSFPRLSRHQGMFPWKHLGPRYGKTRCVLLELLSRKFNPAVLSCRASQSFVSFPPIFLQMAYTTFSFHYINIYIYVSKKYSFSFLVAFQCCCTVSLCGTGCLCVNGTVSGKSFCPHSEALASKLFME